MDITIIMGPGHVATLMICQYCTMQAAKAVNNDSRYVLLVCHVPTESASGIVGRSGTTGITSTCGSTIVP